MKRALSAILGLAFLAGCGSAHRDEPYTAPLHLSDEKLQTGQQVFMEHCHQSTPAAPGDLRLRSTTNRCRSG